MKKTYSANLAIMGATPGGLAAAIQAARLGLKVLVVEPLAHIGGMTTSGLGKSDVERREVIGGIFVEFVERARARYAERYGEESSDYGLCREGYYVEPSVAEAVFHEMIEGAGDIQLLIEHDLQSARVENSRLLSIEAVSRRTGSQSGVAAEVFIDATYEGDLLAKAGARFRLGREACAEFDEPHAGVIYYDYERGKLLPGSTGEADNRLPAYTYRLCLTRDARKGRILEGPPDGYDRSDYLGYHEDLAAGRLSAPAVFKEGWGYYPEHFDTLMRAFSVTDLPGGKVDVNINPRPLAFPFPEQNEGYIEGSPETRRRIEGRHRSLTVGLLWFLQNDASVPSAHRALARQYSLPADEFTDNGHFPWQLYIREGRRLVGCSVLTEHDVTFSHERAASAVHDDTIAMGEFPIDSFPVRRRQAGDTKVLEGYLGMLAHITRPYAIPYRVMVPETIDGLIVSVPVSATHVAFSSIRMEPTWMALGQAAGTAAWLCCREKKAPRHISVGELQRLLVERGQVLPDVITRDFQSAEGRTPASALTPCLN